MKLFVYDDGDWHFLLERVATPPGLSGKWYKPVKGLNEYSKTELASRGVQRMTGNYNEKYITPYRELKNVAMNPKNKPFMG